MVLVYHYLRQREKHKQRVISLLLRNHDDTFILQKVVDMNLFITTEEFNEAADCSLHNGMS